MDAMFVICIENVLRVICCAHITNLFDIGKVFSFVILRGLLV